jgi:hypothetical protein
VEKRESVAYFKVLPQHLPGVLRKITKSLSEELVSRKRYKLKTSRIHSKSATYLTATFSLKD